MSSTTLIQPGANSVAAPRAKASRTHPSLSKRANASLWTVQTVLALLFLFAGGMKLIVPIDALAAQSHLPGEFMKFIGIAETLGGLGLILPGLTRIRVGLTPLAAAGLVIIMIGATIVTLVQGPGAGAIVPFVVGSLCATVAYRRRGLLAV